MLKVWRWTVECWDLYQKGLGNFDVLKFVLLCFGVFSISYSWIAWNISEMSVHVVTFYLHLNLLFFCSSC